MTVEIGFHYGDRDTETILISNGYHTRMVELGVYLAVRVMCSPGGDFWYSERFEQPSAHNGMQFDTLQDCEAIARTLHTIVHALEEGAANDRAWVTAADQSHLRTGTYERFLRYLNGATALTIT